MKKFFALMLAACVTPKAATAPEPEKKDTSNAATRYALTVAHNAQCANLFDAADFSTALCFSDNKLFWVRVGSDKPLSIVLIDYNAPSAPVKVEEAPAPAPADKPKKK